MNRPSLTEKLWLDSVMKYLGLQYSWSCLIFVINMICDMEGRRLNYPVGRQDFATIREDGCLYVDKTDLLYNLIQYNKYVFLSRPRRFGKSLLLSTIRYYFEGRKELFEGLKIMGLEKDWKKYPVLHLELGSIDSGNEKGLTAELERSFLKWERLYEIMDKSDSLSARFKNIIEAAREQTGERVVILIDEYDNPLINTIHRKELYEAHRTLLKSLYSNLKGMDEYIRFAMLTGVSRFSNTTVFSGLNNILDITFNEDYDTICGFTRKEIEENLGPGVESLARKEGCTSAEAMALLKEEYDGYHFTEEMTDIYNPFSLLACLQNRRIDNYWVQSAVPEFLVRKLECNRISYQNLFQSYGTPSSLSVADAAFDSPVALLYQTGYLTIKSYDRENRQFRLGIPNKEVDEGLFRYLLAGYYSHDYMVPEKSLRNMSECLRDGKVEEFLERLKSLLSGISYELEGKMTELDFERTLFVIFHVLGFHVHTELETSRGRIDLTIETKDYIYIIELKYDGSSKEALRQIEEKEYTMPWKFDGRKLFKIGINFSSKTRNISDWIVK